MDPEPEPEPDTAGIEDYIAFLEPIFSYFCQICLFVFLASCIIWASEAPGVVRLFDFAADSFARLLAFALLLIALWFAFWLLYELWFSTQPRHRTPRIRTSAAHPRRLLTYLRLVYIPPSRWRELFTYLISGPHWLGEDDAEREHEAGEPVNLPAGGPVPGARPGDGPRPPPTHVRARSREHRRPPPIRIRSATPQQTASAGSPDSARPPIPGAWLEVPTPRSGTLRSPISPVIAIMQAAALTVTTARYWALRILVVLLASISLWPDSMRTAVVAVVLSELFFFLLSTPVRRSVLEAMPKSAALPTPFSPFRRFFSTLRTPRSPFQPIPRSTAGKSKLFDRDERYSPKDNLFGSRSLAAATQASAPQLIPPRRAPPVSSANSIPRGDLHTRATPASAQNRAPIIDAAPEYVSTGRQNHQPRATAISSPLSPKAAKGYQAGDRRHENAPSRPTEVDMEQQAFSEALRPRVYQLHRIARYARCLRMATTHPVNHRFDAIVYQSRTQLYLLSEEYPQTEAEDSTFRAEIAALTQHGIVERYQECRTLVEGIVGELAIARSQETNVAHIESIDDANMLATDLQAALTGNLIPLEEALRQEQQDVAREEQNNVEVGLNIQLDEIRTAFEGINYDMNLDSLTRDFQKLHRDINNVATTVRQHDGSHELRTKGDTLEQEIRAAETQWTRESRNPHLQGSRTLIRRLGQAVSSDLLPSRTSSNAYLCSVYALVMSLRSVGNLDQNITAEDILSAMFTNFDRSQVLLGRRSNIAGIPTALYQEVIDRDAGIQSFMQDPNLFNPVDQARSAITITAMVNERCNRLSNLEVQGLVFMLKFLIHLNAVDPNCRIATITPNSTRANVYSVQYFDFAEDNTFNFRPEQANLIWLYNDNYEGIARTAVNIRRRLAGGENLPYDDEVAAVGHWEGFSRDRSLHNRALVDRWGLSGGRGV